MSIQEPLVRLVAMSVAWAAASTAAQVVQQRSLATLAGFAAAALVYAATRPRSGRRGRPTKYWRGRPVDDRLN